LFIGKLIKHLIMFGFPCVSAGPLVAKSI
jgi:hypothetical protein